MFRPFLLCLLIFAACHHPITKTQKVALAKAQVPTSQRTVAVTIDDLPGISLENYEAVTEKLLTTLKKYDVPAIGFVNEGKLYRKGKLNKKRLTLLDDWLTVGMELGNHTYGHPDYNRLTFEQFSADILKGEKHTKALQTQHGQTMRYFRHPFLHTGNTPQKKEQLEQFLQASGYEIAPVTIDNSEWIFAKAYHIALRENDTAQMKKIGETYVQYMEDKTVFYEKQCKTLFDRAIKQTLLIHANALNGDYLDELLEMYRNRGYAFISMAAALEDTAYQSKDEYAGRVGISWIDRWAITKKVDKTFFKGEPTCPQFIQDYAGLTE